MSSYFNNYGIHIAAYYGGVHTVKQLVANGADINYRNEDGNTPLMVTLQGNAAKDTKYEILNVLLDNGASVKVVNKNGDTALHVALKTATDQTVLKQIVKSLLDNGANVLKANKYGETPVQLACKYTELENLLAVHAAKRKRKNKASELVGYVIACLCPTLTLQRQSKQEVYLLQDVNGDASEATRITNHAEADRGEELPDENSNLDKSVTQEGRVDDRNQDKSASRLVGFDGSSVDVTSMKTTTKPYRHMRNARTTFNNIFTADTPKCLSIRNKIRKQLNVHRQ